MISFGVPTSSTRGVDSQAELCKAANIPGFPTWDIGGKLYPGEQTLEELEEIVGLDPLKGWPNGHPDQKESRWNANDTVFCV